MSETVYLAGNSRSATDTLHTDRDCHLLASARDVVAKDRVALPDDLPVCSACRGVVPDTSAQSKSHYRAAIDADPQEVFGHGD